MRLRLPLLLTAMLLAGCLVASTDHPPEGEVCNGLDDDLDRRVDERASCPPFRQNPGSGEAECVDGACRVARCFPGRVDIDGDFDNGCEAQCTPSSDGIDVCIGGLGDRCADNCDNVDDDCDGIADEGTQAPLSRKPGVCEGYVMVCNGRWGEPFHAGVNRDFEEIETRCDGLDNDCDGKTDESVEGCDATCDGLDDDVDSEVDEDGACRETRCEAGTTSPPCNGCPRGTTVPSDWVCIPPGEFLMGSPADETGREYNEGPQRGVRISQPLLMLATEVAEGHWLATMADFPPNLTVCDDEAALNRPVGTVNWFEAIAYVNTLSESEGWRPCYALSNCSGAPGRGLVCHDPVSLIEGCDGYRLPTEAEWEYAARAGSKGRFWFGDDDDELTTAAWYTANSEFTPHPIGRLRPNRWGLYDVHGNVWEWVHDWYGPYTELSAEGSLLDPLGPPHGDMRAFRGGSFGDFAARVRVAHRDGWPPSIRDWRLGFRPVRPIRLDR